MASDCGPRPGDTCECLEPTKLDLLNLYSIIMADVEATHPSLAAGDTIIDDGEEAESKVYHTLPSELEFPIHVFTGNYAHEAEGGRNGERS